MDKIGAAASSVQVGANAGIESAFEDFSPEGYQRFEAMLDNVYDGFKDRVARGRKLDPAAVEAIAKGRIWSGEDAKAKGLVDALGGMDTALALAKEAIGVPADGAVTLKLYPPPQSPLRAPRRTRALGREIERGAGRERSRPRPGAAGARGALAADHHPARRPA